MRARVITVVAVLVCAMAAPAAADVDDPTRMSAAERSSRARQLFELGRSRFNIDDYEGAMQVFKQAYLYDPKPLFLYNLGATAAKLNRTAEAIEYYERFIREAPTAPQRDKAERKIAELKEQLAREEAQKPAREAERPPPTKAPAETVAPAPPLGQPAAAVEARAAPRRSRTGLYVALGIVGALVVGGVVTAVVLTQTSSGPPSTEFGTLHF
jgi:tetratricopeptide (TPR) repeat protein